MMLGQMDRYIAKTVAMTMLVVLLSFVALTSVFALVDEIQDHPPGYTFADALLHVLFTTPTRTNEVVPFVVFVGSLIGLGRLSSQSEITVFRSAGVSLVRLFASVSIPAIIVLIGSMLMGEYLVPQGEEAGAAVKIKAEQASETIHLYDRTWYREGRMFTGIDGIDSDGHLLGVWQFEIDDALALRVTRRADKAQYDRATKEWLLTDVVETVIGEDATRVVKLPTSTWKTAADPRMLGTKVLVSPQELSLADLQFQIDYMIRERLNPGRYQVAFWSKVLQPLAILGLVLIAVGFVVGPLREVGMGARLTVGIAVGIGFKYLQDLFAPMSLIFGLPPWIAVSIPILAAWILGAILVRRAG